MMYILLIVLAFILDSPWPVVAAIALLVFATWETEPRHVKASRRLTKAARKSRLRNEQRRV